MPKSHRPYAPEFRRQMLIWSDLGEPRRSCRVSSNPAKPLAHRLVAVNGDMPFLATVSGLEAMTRLQEIIDLGQVPKIRRS